MRAARRQAEILKAVNYDALPMMSVQYVTRLANGEWIPIDGDQWGEHNHAYCRVSKNFTGPQLEFNTVSGFGHFQTCRDDLNTEDWTALEQVDVSVGQASFGITTQPSFFEVEAKLTLLGGSVSACDLNLGLGMTSVAGIKDDSLKLKALGTGFTFGRKVGVSIFDNEVSLDLGKIGQCVEAPELPERSLSALT